MKNLIYLLLLFFSANSFAEKCTDEQITFTLYSLPRYELIYENYPFPDHLLCQKLIDEIAISEFNKYSKEYYYLTYGHPTSENNDSIEIENHKPQFQENPIESSNESSNTKEIIASDIQLPKYNNASIENLKTTNQNQELIKISIFNNFTTYIFIFTNKYKSYFYLLLSLVAIFLVVLLFKNKSKDKGYKQCRDCGSLVKPGRSQCFICGSYV